MHNRRFLRTVVLLLCLAMLLPLTFAAAGCTGGSGTASGTDAPTGSATEPSTQPDTDAQPGSETVTTGGGTETETDAPAPVPTRFNEGKVDYKTEKKTTVYEAFDENGRNTVMEKGATGVVTLFDENFSDGDPNCGGKATSRSAGATGVHEGKLCIPYNGTDGVGGGWTTWCPEVNTNFTDFSQIQLSANIEVVGGGNPAATGFIGCYLSNYTYSIADNAGDGIWFSFVSQHDRIAVFGSDQAHWGWPGGNVLVQLWDGALSGQFRVDLVCTDDLTTTMFINGIYALSVRIEDSRIHVYDMANEQVYEEDYNMSAAKGSHYSVFCHGGGFMIDDMQVYGASRGSTVEEVVVTATPKEGYALGLDITNRNDLVGICYTMWFNAIFGDGTGKMTNMPNVPEMTEKYGFSAEYGFGTKDEQHNHLGQFHYWSEPAQGYYRSTDTNAIRNNMRLLYKAGVDFLILDYTYAGAGYQPGSSEWTNYISKPMNALLDTIMQMRAEGEGTPYVVMWMNDDSLFDVIYQHFYGVEKWKDCFVFWNGKPFVMRWIADESCLDTDKFTVRGMYGLRGQAAPGQWTYLEVSNKNTVSYYGGKPEHVGVAVATQETYMSLPTAHGRAGGVFWYSQWLNAFKVHPKIVSVTWWNEWTAQLYHTDAGYIFTDNFNQEYSRDIEPMKGGHGDQYYRWLCEYIRAYRAGEDCPVLVEDGYEQRAYRALRDFLKDK